MFTLHLEHSEFRKLSRPPTDIVLPYEINPIFISRLQDHSKSFLKARTKKYLLNRIDTLFRSNGNFIKAYKTAEPKEAVLALLKQFPEYRHLTSSQISHIVRLYYKNKDGETLKLNSIRSVLKTLENSE